MSNLIETQIIECEERLRLAMLHSDVKELDKTIIPSCFIMPYIEVKSRKTIDSTLAKKIIKKGDAIAVLTTGHITKQAKEAFDRADIAWAEYIEETQFLASEAQEGE